MKRRKLRIGFDFDGVIAYSPTRLIRAPISWFKRNILKKKGVSFFVPKHKWQMTLWAGIFNPSVLPEKGLGKLKLQYKNYDSYLITGRFDFLENNMKNWLAKHKADKIFNNIFVNSEREQPHVFKEKLIKKLKLDYFIDDNLDTILYLKEHCKSTKILWIFNIIDRRHNYYPKFPDLEKVLEYVEKENTV